jgi:hypothetical protein
MRSNIQKALPGSLLLFTLIFHAGLNQNLKAQQPTPSVRQRFVIVAASQRCQPASVKSVAFGKQPPDALLAQATVENGSDKVITAVKLGWKVYSYAEGPIGQLAFCDPQTAAAEVFLSGATPLIQLEALASKETGTISISPLVAPTRATKTVFVDHPLLTADDVKSLPLDNSTPKYEVVMFVSEIHYADGTTWEIKSN